MSHWRETIIHKFRNQNSSFIFVKDEDSLLNEEQILNDILALGYEVVRFEDSITFRYLYEQKYRDKEYRLLVYANEDITLPYEFSKKALEMEIDIQTIFPNYSSKVIRAMDREDFDELSLLHRKYKGSPTERETLDFIIRNFYKVPYEIIDREASLYKVLLSVHYEKREMPELVKQFLYEQWKKVSAFQNLPLKEIIFSASAFYRFLEEKWEEFVHELSTVQDGQVNDPVTLEYNSPLAHSDVRRMMNDLFLEGILKKVKDVDSTQLPDWVKIGVEEKDEKEDVQEKIEHYYEEVTKRLPEVKRYKDWLMLMQYLAELKSIALQRNGETDSLLKQINGKFQSWMLEHYHTLTSLPPFPQPKLVHHIPHVMNREKRANEKVALLVMDGMSFIQWVFIRNFLQKKGFRFEENGVFAWVPTLTSVSRQAIFSGNPPYTFGRTITTTNSEEKWWKAFWEEHGTLKQYVTYQRSLGTETYHVKNIKGLNRKSTKVFGAVVDVIDQLTHHSVLGEKSLLTNLDLWLESGYLERLLSDLKEQRYKIYITSDHGNTTATGIGRYSEGVLVDQRGERARIYHDKLFYEDAAKKIPGFKWSNIGLPEDYHVLLANDGEAFTTKGDKIITHGGISIEEVIVPFIKVID